MLNSPVQNSKETFVLRYYGSAQKVMKYWRDILSKEIKLLLPQNYPSLLEANELLIDCGHLYRLICPMATMILHVIFDMNLMVTV